MQNTGWYCRQRPGLEAHPWLLFPALSSHPTQDTQVCGNQRPLGYPGDCSRLAVAGLGLLKKPPGIRRRAKENYNCFNGDTVSLQSDTLIGAAVTVVNMGSRQGRFLLCNNNASSQLCAIASVGAKRSPTFGVTADHDFSGFRPAR